MSIWCSTGSVVAEGYIHSGVHPWEHKGAPAEVDFAAVSDYVANDKRDGSSLLPWLRLGIRNPERGEDAEVLLTEAGARKVIAELTWWLDRPKYRPRNRRTAP